jgi:toxin ParE1/3/4
LAGYRLTEAAAGDLLAIASFGIERFGVAAARRYHQRLAQRLEDVAARPLAYPAVGHIRPGYRRSVCGVHSIYFRIVENGVEVVRILGRQDVRDLEPV